MLEPIVVIDYSEILEGKLEKLERGIRELAEFVEANEPRAIAYDVYFNEEETMMTVLQVHPDSASAEFHMEVAAPVFRQLADLISLSAIDIYGKPSDRLVEQMRRKAEMLGNAILTVHELHAGFARFGAD